MGILRRLKAALRIGLTWAMGWGAAAGVIFALVVLEMDPDLRSRAGWGGGMQGVIVNSLVATLIAATLGLIAGVVFSLLLGAGERKRSVDQLSLGRITLLGAIGSLALYVAGSTAIELFAGWVSIGIGFVTGTMLGAGVIAAFGAASAATTLRLAQRASIDAGDEMAILPPSTAS